MYAYDIKQECFLKHVSNNRNYPALHYFAIDNHMYLIKDQKKCKSLTEKAKERNINSWTSSIVQCP